MAKTYLNRVFCLWKERGRKPLPCVLWVLLLLLVMPMASLGQYPAANYQTIIPHSATGGGFLTRISINNLAGCTNNVTVTGYYQNGAISRTMNFALQAGATQEIVGSESQRTQGLVIEWFAIGSDQRISASVLFDFNGQAIQPPTTFRTAVGALAASPDMAFTAPVHVAGTEVTVGIALANLGSGSNTVNMTLLDKSGLVMGQDSVTIGGYGQTAFALQDRPAFRSIVLGAAEFVGTLSFTASSVTQPIAAVVIGNNVGQLFSLPVTTGAAGGCGYYYQPKTSQRMTPDGKKQKKVAVGEPAWACNVPPDPTKSPTS